MNKKERVLALKSALTYKAKEKELVVIDSLNIKSLKTKDIKEVNNKLNDFVVDMDKDCCIISASLRGIVMEINEKINEN